MVMIMVMIVTVIVIVTVITTVTSREGTPILDLTDMTVVTFRG